MWKYRYFTKNYAGAETWSIRHNKFIEACLKGDLEDAKKSWESVDVMYEKEKLCCANEDTCFHLAAESGSLALVEWLASITPGHDKRWRPNTFGENPLHVACIAGREDVVKYLAGFGELERTDFQQNGVFHFAVKSNNTAVLEILKQHGASINQKNVQGKTPFQIACENGNLSAAERLVEYGCEIFTTTLLGDSALTLAARSGYTDIVKLLLQKGFESNIVSPSSYTNETALHIACAKGNLSMAELLVENGANVNAKTWRSETPLHYLCDYLIIDNMNPSIPCAKIRGGTCLYHKKYDFKEREKIARILINKDACTSVANNTGETVLHHLCRKCTCTSIGILKLVVNCIPSQEKRTILNQQTDCVRVRAQINERTQSSITREFFLSEPGVTCLHLACANSNVTLIKYLLINGANANITTAGNWTPLHAAATCSITKGKLKKIITHLRRYMTDESIGKINSEGHTAIHIITKTSLYHNGIEGLDEILQEVPDSPCSELNGINALDNTGRSALYNLVENEHYFDASLIDRLVARGADVNMSYPDKSLVEIAVKETKIAILQKLLTYKILLPMDFYPNREIYSFRNCEKLLRLLINAGCHEYTLEFFANAVEMGNKEECYFALQADPLLANRCYQSDIAGVMDDEDYDAELMVTLLQAARDPPLLQSLCGAFIRSHVAECSRVGSSRYSILPLMKELPLPGLLLQCLDILNGE